MAQQGTPNGTGLSAGTVLTGLHAVLVMLAAAVVMPLLVGRALKLPPGELGLMVNATVLVCGLGTLLQSFGAAGIAGIRLPVMTGAAFAALGPLLVIAGDAGLGSAGDRLQIIAGATLAAGALVLLLAPVCDRLLPLFPPVVRGAVMVMVGIVLLRSSVGWLVAPQESGVPDLGPPARLGMAGAVLIAIVLISRFGGRALAGMAVLLGIVLGGGAALGLGVMSLAQLDAAPWGALVKPLPFGSPRFEPIPALSLAIVMLVAMIETSALCRSLAAAARSPDADADATRGVRADGIAGLLAGVFSGMPCASGWAAGDAPENSGSGPAGLGVDRLGCAAAGIVLVLLALSPKLGALLVSVPQFVLAGAGLVMFGAVAASGVKILADVDYDSQRQNLFIVALSVGIGLIPIVAPPFFKVILARTPALAPLLQSSVLLSAVAAVLLNLFFNGIGRASATVKAGGGSNQ